MGFNNQNGEKVRSAFTLPTVDGSHPYMRNLGVLKPGYTSRMSLITIGNIYHGTDYVRTQGLNPLMMRIINHTSMLR